jgi:catechol 2,3-dioxygenase-like lactoylglutathione lyase family enzyme
METAYRIDHIALLVRDLEESARFYIDVVGIAELPNPMGGTHIRWFEIGGSQRIHMQAGDIAATHVEKQTHIALSARDFDAVLARLRASGADFSDMKGTPGAINLRPDGMRAVFLQDPNGYWLEINDFPQP